MEKIAQKVRTPEGYFALAILSVAALGAFSESARAAGMGLFQYVADSYFVMFVDRLSTIFICF